MNCSKIAIDKHLIIGYGTIFAVISFIMLQAPLTSDDFIFADLKVSNFYDTMYYVLHYGNGRLLGNLCAVFFVKHRVLCAFVKAFVITMTICLIPRIVFHKTNELLPVVVLLVLGVSAGIFSQVYTWTSGFMNYVPPVALMLLCLAIFESGRYSSAGGALILVLGCASQLFVEHNTIVNLFIAFLLYIQCCRKQDSVRKKLAVLWLCGSILGTAVMVMIPRVFGSATSPIAGYRDIAISLADIVVMTKGFVLSALIIYAQNTVLLAISSMVLLSLIGKPQKKVQMIRCAVYILYPLVSLEYQINQGDIQSIWDIRFFLLCGGFVVYSAIAAYEVVTRVKDCETKVEMLNYLVLCILSLAPFCVVRPFGDRCLFLSYFFACMMLLTTVRYSLAQQKKMKDNFLNVSRCFAALLMLFLIVEFARVGVWDRNRTSYIEDAMASGDTQITIYEIPSRFTFDTYLGSRYYYYEVHGDIEFSVVDYSVWMSKYYYE